MERRVIICTVIALSFSLSGLRAQSLYLAHKEGSRTAYSLSDIRKISFERDQIWVHTTVGESKAYVFSEILNLNYWPLTSVQQKPLQVRAPGTLFIYPNPVHDLLTIQWPSMPEMPGLLEIFSMEGKKALEITLSPYTLIYQIDISHLHSGIYVCRVHQGTSITSARFIKQ